VFLIFTCLSTQWLSFESVVQTSEQSLVCPLAWISTGFTVQHDTTFDSGKVHTVCSFCFFVLVLAFCVTPSESPYVEVFFDFKEKF
jgi:hypothetical protein